MELSSQSEWHALCDKRSGLGGDAALTEDERVWVNICLIDSTNGGGLISFFYNSGADTLPDCLRALDILRAGDVRLQVERVCALFGDSVPTDGSARNRIINSWPDNASRDALLKKVDRYLYGRFPDLETRLVGFLGNSGLAT
jgi:hypothetical protein